MNAPLNPRFSVTPGHRSRKPFIGLFLVGLVPALMACAEVINHAEMPESHGLTVVGTGQAVADPDVAIANVGVEVRDANPQRAVELNNKQMSLLVTNLKALGIQDPD